jgi:hypothetical protein
MKKVLIWVGVLCFLIIIVSAIFSIAESHKKGNGDKLAALSSLDKLSATDSQKSYALRFPVL